MNRALAPRPARTGSLQVALVALVGTLLAGSVAGEAAAKRKRAPVPTPRQLKVAELQRRMLAAARLPQLTPETIMDALALEVDPPRMISDRRREWSVHPSELYAGGRIVEAGDWVVVEVAPAAALQVSFEDLASGMLTLPYWRDDAEAPVGEDPAERRLFAANHMFLVPAGMLAVQVPTTVPAHALDHDVKAAREAHQTTIGLISRSVLVGTILIDNEAPDLNELKMIPLADRRRHAPVAAGTRP
jgi:hypothetical protein